MFDPKLTSWRAQYERLERSYRRLQENQDSSLDKDDELQRFWEHCLHLRDWVAKDQNLVPKVDFKDLERGMHQHPALRDACDLANASKHMTRGHGERKTFVTNKSVNMVPGKGAHVLWTVTRDDGTTVSPRNWCIKRLPTGNAYCEATISCRRQS